MTKNLNKEFRELDGTVLKDEKDNIIKLHIICINALSLPYRDEENLPGEEKVKRWKLAQALYAKPEEVDLKSEDITLLKKLVAKAYGTAITAQAWEMLEE